MKMEIVGDHRVVQMHFDGLHGGGNIPEKVISIPVDGALLHDQFGGNLAQIPVLNGAPVVVEQSGNANGHFVHTSRGRGRNGQGGHLNNFPFKIDRIPRTSAMKPNSPSAAVARKWKEIIWDWVDNVPPRSKLDFESKVRSREGRAKELPA